MELLINLNDLAVVPAIIGTWWLAHVYGSKPTPYAKFLAITWALIGIFAAIPEVLQVLEVRSPRSVETVKLMSKITVIVIAVIYTLHERDNRS